MPARVTNRGAVPPDPAVPVQLTLWETSSSPEVPPNAQFAASSSGRAWAVPFDSDPYRSRWRGRRVRTIPGPDTWNPTTLEGAA